MRLVLSYYAVDLDKSGAQAHFPIEAPSATGARALLREAVSQAVTHGNRAFMAFGFRHYTHNFVTEVTRERVERMTAHQRARNKPVPVVLEAHGRMYGYKGFKLMTVDEWFSQPKDGEE